MFAKLKSNGTIQPAPNPLRIVVANPSYDLLRQFGWHEVVTDDPPEYDPETQTISSHYEMQGDVIVQVWTVEDIPQTDADAQEK